MPHHRPLSSPVIDSVAGLHLNIWPFAAHCVLRDVFFPTRVFVLALYMALVCTCFVRTIVKGDAKEFKADFAATPDEGRKQKEDNYESACSCHPCVSSQSRVPGSRVADAGPASGLVRLSRLLPLARPELRPASFLCSCNSGSCGCVQSARSSLSRSSRSRSGGLRSYRSLALLPCPPSALGFRNALSSFCAHTARSTPAVWRRCYWFGTLKWSYQESAGFLQTSNLCVQFLNDIAYRHSQNSLAGEMISFLALSLLPANGGWKEAFKLR